MDKSDSNTKKPSNKGLLPSVAKESVVFNEGLGNVISYQNEFISRNREGIAVAKSRLKLIRLTLDDREQS